MQRRDVLRALGGALAIPALSALTPALGCSSVSSGSSRRRLDRIGVQLYTLRHEMERDVPGTLARVARIGYKEVEFAGYFGREPTTLRLLLDTNGLSAPSAHVPYATMGDGWDAALDAAKVIGHEYLVIPWLDEKDRRSVDDYRRVAERLNRAGAESRRAGVRLAYHNHDFEFTPIGGVLPYDVLLEATDPALVAMEMDLYWITKSGYDPLAYFAKYPGRFELVHVKDSAGPPEHRMVEVGRGKIDWPQILGHHAQAGIRHYIVEHDNPADAYASIEVSYRYLSRIEV
jgi:sugar phosphate isomerase/epimerase